MTDQPTEEKEALAPELVYLDQYAIKSGFVYKNNAITACPYAPRTFLPPKFAGGEVMVQTHPCNIACPKCNVLKDKNSEQHFLEITCGGAVLTPPVALLDVVASDNGKVKSIFEK